ncbi:hypothetical protein [Tenacibaculum xiamenense]|uniref:hypothetical protein n=1 Tax=Tenacibaculum xiamenense TaxID=1261553 RepID=UPI003895B727
MEGSSLTYYQKGGNEKELLFAQEFPYFYQFITKEIRMLEFAADLALSCSDEEGCENLNHEAHKLSIALDTLTQRYSMDLFE